jgi:hypothetical protein
MLIAVSDLPAFCLRKTRRSTAKLRWVMSLQIIDHGETFRTDELFVACMSRGPPPKPGTFCSTLRRLLSNEPPVPTEFFTS